MVEATPEQSGASEPGGGREEESTDVCRSESGSLGQERVWRESEAVDADEASRVVAREMYSGGLHHSEVAEKYDISVRSVKWCMKKRGIGFTPREMGEPPRDVAKGLRSIVSQ